MLTGIYQSATIFATLIAFYVTDLVFITRYGKQRKSGESGRSWSYTMFIVVAVALLIAQPILLPFLGLQIKAWWGILIQAAGTLLLLSGLGLHGWSRAHLQRFYAEDADVQPDHYVVDTGPYAYVRHPMFTSYFLLIIGLLLINPAVTTLLMAIYAFWDFTGAAKRDEDLLAKEVPGYAAYMVRTPSRFLPWSHRQSREE
ncbi:MAG: isoprenylcysteine carboxylmethyltransferase family protein [Anaerolineae bacterium]|jgi:protein-S-isoprenylcysteine O-methyltransferase Ste14